MFNGYLDGLFNLHNIFAQYDEDIRFNVVGILGMGFNSSFGFDDKVKEWDKSPVRSLPPTKSALTTKRFSLYAQASVQLYVEQCA